MEDAKNGIEQITGIEGPFSQQFSEWMFYFLVFSILIFIGISISYLVFSRKKLKRGEIILFLWIGLGVIGAVVFGAMQMLHGYLF